MSSFAFAPRAHSHANQPPHPGRKGSNFFADTAPRGPIQYRYKINARGLPTVSFKSSVNADKPAVVQAMANKNMAVMHEKVRNMPVIQRLPPDKQENAIMRKINSTLRKMGVTDHNADIEDRLDTGFFRAAEVHIQGPVLPDRITYTGEMFINGKLVSNPAPVASPP